MERSLLAAVSGIDANQTFLDVIANNVANTNTTGFKEDTAQFDDLLAQQIEGAGTPNAALGLGGVNGVAVGSGVRVAAVTDNFAEGTLLTTNNPTDVAIQGSGFFQVNSGGQTLYTRDGHFLFDANGDLVTDTGGLVQGWMPTTIGGAINTAAPTTSINIPVGTAIPPKATTTVNIGGNLPSNATVGTKQVTTINVYDTQGNAVPMTLTFTNTAANTWSYAATVDVGAGAPNTIAAGQLTFNVNGQLSAATATTGVLTGAPPAAFTVATVAENPDTPNGANLPSFNLSVPATQQNDSLTQFNAATTAAATSQDGYASGTLAGISFGQDGIITGSFTNGEALNLGQVALANVANPTGMAKVGSNYYQATANSGNVLVGPVGANSTGSLVGGALEGSNVDMGKQLTNLVIAQTSYQANTKVVTTSDTVLNALVNMA